MGGIGSGAKPKRYPEEMVREVQHLYTALGHSQMEVAERLGVSLKVIYRLMINHDIPRRPQIKRDQRGLNNATWRGDSATYAAFHKRVEAEFGKPSRCARCGTDDPSKTYDWANLTGNYHDIADYERMCRSCHRRYDNARRRGGDAR